MDRATPRSDTAAPARLIAALAAVLVLLTPTASRAHGGEVEAVVEAQTADGGYLYGIGLHWDDGDPVTEAHLLLRGTLDGVQVFAEPVEREPGVYVGLISLDGPGDWAMDLAVHHPDSDGTISFVQVVGSPDATVTWTVAVDTVAPARVGSVPDPATSLLDPPNPTTNPPTTTTTPPPDSTSPTSVPGTAAAPPSTSAGPDPNTVVVDLGTGRPGPAADIAMRLAHLAAIGLWVVPLVAVVLGRSGRPFAIAAVTGAILTTASGTVLGLWGAPVGFPGLADPEDLLDVAYGAEYLVAFSLKMVAVVVAAVSTVVWASRTSRMAAWVALGAAAVAVVAVTAVGQFHLLTHG